MPITRMAAPSSIGVARLVRARHVAPRTDTTPSGCNAPTATPSLADKALAADRRTREARPDQRRQPGEHERRREAEHATSPDTSGTAMPSPYSVSVPNSIDAVPIAGPHARRARLQVDRRSRSTAKTSAATARPLTGRPPRPSAARREQDRRGRRGETDAGGRELEHRQQQTEHEQGVGRARAR